MLWIGDDSRHNALRADVASSARMQPAGENPVAEKSA
jgi:hypothetical protein